MNMITIPKKMIKKVSIPRNEYLRLKNLDRRFRGLFEYFENLTEIREARMEIKNKKFISQDKLFERLGV